MSEPRHRNANHRIFRENGVLPRNTLGTARHTNADTTTKRRAPDIHVDDRPGLLASLFPLSPMPKRRRASPIASERSPSNLSSSNRDVDDDLWPHQSEYRQCESSNLSLHKKSRRRKRSRTNGSAGLVEPSEIVDVDGDDNASVAEVEVSSASSPAANTHFSIDLISIVPPPKQRFRQRMLQQPPEAPTPTPSIKQVASLHIGDGGGSGSGGSKRPFYSARSDNDIVDELSEEFYTDAQPAKRTNNAAGHTLFSMAADSAAARSSSPRRAPPLSLSYPKTIRIGTSPYVDNIVQCPLQVDAAFRNPSYRVTAMETNVLMTIDPATPHILFPTSDGTSEVVELFWLRVDLRDLRTVQQHPTMSMMLFGLPQKEHRDGPLGTPLGIQFGAIEEVRRVWSWMMESRFCKHIDFKELHRRQLERTFAKLSHDVEGQRMPREAVSNQSHPEPANRAEQSPDPSDVRATGPSVRSEALHLTRTRSGRLVRGLGTGSNGRGRSGDMAEPVDVDGTSKDALVEIPDSRSARLRGARATRSTSALGLLGGLDADPKVERWTEMHPDWARDWRIPLTYSRTTVDKDDVARLDEGQFLNDNIINFYLQFLQDELKARGSSLARRIYFHNTFFYEKLKPSRGNVISFDGVQRWTAKVDLFSYDYIVVPVNDRFHWWVAIICNVPKILEAAVPEAQVSKADVEASSPQTVASVASVASGVEADPMAAQATSPSATTLLSRDVDEMSQFAVAVDRDNGDDYSPKDTLIPMTPILKHTLNGLHKAMPIEVPDSQTRPWRAFHTETAIVLDSGELDVDRAVAADHRKGTPTPSDSAWDRAEDMDKGGGDDVQDDDEVTEIKSDLVTATARQQPQRGARRTSGATGRQSFGGRAKKKVFIPSSKNRDPKDPRIFTLDSLGTVHSASVDHLKQWLLAEIAARKGVKPGDPGRLGTTAKSIPQQENFCDCGVYLLLYIEEFIKDPDAFIEDLVLRRERSWDMTAPMMRSQLRDLILHKQTEFQESEEAKKAKKKGSKRIAAAAAAAAAAEAADAKAAASSAAFASVAVAKPAGLPVSEATTVAGAAALQRHNSTARSSGVSFADATSKTTESTPDTMDADNSERWLTRQQESPADEGNQTVASADAYDMEVEVVHLPRRGDGDISSVASSLGPADMGLSSPFREVSPGTHGQSRQH